MLEFHSGNTRAVNPQRAVLEALELAYGETDPQCDLVLINATVGHDVAALSEVVRNQCPAARVLAASCAGVVGRDGPGESMHDIALIGLRGEGFVVALSTASTDTPPMRRAWSWRGGSSNPTIRCG